MWLKVCIILFAACIVACNSTREYSDNGKKFQSYSDCAYMGTFSSVSIIKSKRITEFNDSLTAFANYIYDSVIKTKVKKIDPVPLTNSLSGALTKEITRCALQFQKTNDVHCIEPSALIDSVSSLNGHRYSSFFINYGNIWSKKQQRKYVAGQTLLVTAVVVGVALIVTLAILTESSGNHNSFGSCSGSKKNNEEIAESRYTSGMTCVYMIYDKNAHEFCYVRKAYFNSDKTDNNTFNPFRVSEQMEILFNNKAKPVKNI